MGLYKSNIILLLLIASLTSPTFQSRSNRLRGLKQKI